MKEREPISQPPRLTRRAFAKVLIVLSGITAFAPLLAIAEYISGKKSKSESKYPRTRIAKKNDVLPNNALIFMYPHEARPAMLLHLEAGTYFVGNYWEGTKRFELDSERFVAYDVTCTHLGCQVGWIESEKKMGPSCHGARFSPVDGTVLAGPPLRPLPKIKTEIEDNGDIYADGYESGLPLYGEEG